MSRGSEELTNARKEEIIRACASLYETMSFKEITINFVYMSAYELIYTGTKRLLTGGQP